MLLYLIPLTSQKFFCTPVVRDHRCLAPAPSALQAPGCLCRSLRSLHSALSHNLPPSPQNSSAGLWFGITTAFHLLPQRFKPLAASAAPSNPYTLLFPTTCPRPHNTLLPSPLPCTCSLSSSSPRLPLPLTPIPPLCSIPRPAPVPTTPFCRPVVCHHRRLPPAPSALQACSRLCRPPAPLGTLSRHHVQLLPHRHPHALLLHVLGHLDGLLRHAVPGIW